MRAIPQLQYGEGAIQADEGQSEHARYPTLLLQRLNSCLVQPRGLEELRDLAEEATVSLVDDSVLVPVAKRAPRATAKSVHRSIC